MCGACGIAPDWAGAVVSGPLRRRDIGRCLNALISTATVQGITRGWMVKARTGAATPAQTFDQLIEALIPHARIDSWEQLESALLTVSAPGRVDVSDTGWPLVSGVPSDAAIVLESVTHLPAHMKLAAFVLGARVLASPMSVAANIDGEHWLAARDGHLLRRPAARAVD